MADMMTTSHFPPRRAHHDDARAAIGVCEVGHTYVQRAEEPRRDRCGIVNLDHRSPCPEPIEWRVQEVPSDG